MTTTRKALVVAAALLGLAAVAQEATAQTVIHSRTARTAGGWTSNTYIGPAYEQPSARILNLRGLTDPVPQADRDAWVARCRPTLVPGEHGVKRWTYAAKGCEYGP